jgi:hypothetical protein
MNWETQFPDSPAADLRERGRAASEQETVDVQQTETVPTSLRTPAAPVIL